MDNNNKSIEDNNNNKSIEDNNNNKSIEDNNKIIKKYSSISENCNNILNCPFYWCGSCCIGCWFLPYIVYINTKKY
jgi:hypothetical protein